MRLLWARILSQKGSSLAAEFQSTLPSRGTGVTDHLLSLLLGSEAAASFKIGPASN